MADAEEQNLDNLELLEGDAPDESEELEQAFNQEQEQSQEDEAAERAAQAGAQMAVSFVKTITQMKYPYVVIDEGSEQQVTEKTAAVVRKYGGGLPPWLEPYREEIELGMVLAGVGFGVFLQVQEHEAQEQQKKKEQEEAANGASEAGQPEHAVE